MVQTQAQTSSLHQGVQKNSMAAHTTLGFRRGFLIRYCMGVPSPCQAPSQTAKPLACNGRNPGGKKAKSYECNGTGPARETARQHPRDGTVPASEAAEPNPCDGSSHGCLPVAG